MEVSVNNCEEAFNNTIRYPNDPKYIKIYNECKNKKRGDKQ